MPFLSYIYPKINKDNAVPVPTTTPAPIVRKLKKTKEDYNNEFKKYYSKRFSEELKPYSERPSLSLSYMMMMSALPKIVEEKAQKEWDSNNLV